MPKNIALINQNAGYLMVDIANAYATKYDKIVLIAGMIKPMDRELNPAVETQKIIKYNRTSFMGRLFTWSWGSLQVFFLLLLKYRNYEVIYTTNPPFAYFSSLFINHKFSIIVYDIYPDILKNIGLGQKNLIYILWSKINKKLFRQANKVIILSKGMLDPMSFYIEPQKIKVIPNWSSSDKFIPIKKEENPFLKVHNLADKFIVLYSGNMGYTHSVETIIEVAKTLESIKTICFLIIGEGTKKEKLIQLSRQYHLENCVFMSWQPASVLPYSLASADLAIITLSDENATLSVPSKTYNLLAVGSPLLCIAPDNSELSLLVGKYQNGRCFTKDQIKEIANYIFDLSNNRNLQKELSRNSLEASKEYSYVNALNYL